VIRVGLISDTHGLLRPQALEFLAGCDHIIHAGDIGNVGILDSLGQIAPVVAVRGNNDHGDWAQRFPETAFLKLGEIFVYVLHDVGLLDLDPEAAGVQVVVAGHSHLPAVQERQGALFVNPGSAGPRRFRLPISVGELRITDGKVTARTIELNC
jgi:hypothetical protein